MGSMRNSTRTHNHDQIGNQKHHFSNYNSSPKLNESIKYDIGVPHRTQVKVERIMTQLKQKD